MSIGGFSIGQCRQRKGRRKHEISIRRQASLCGSLILINELSGETNEKDQEITYKKLLTGEARELLDSAGCADVEIVWGSAPAESVEAIMQAAGLR